METKIVRLNPDNIDTDLICEMGEIIKNGGLVAFPTETVYGLGANAFMEKSVEDIFRAKGRPNDNPLIVHVSSFDEIEELAREIPQSAKMLFERFSPGPLTVILKKSEKVPDVVTAGLDTVAIRIPSHKIALELIKSAKAPIAAPSANRSGKPSPTKGEHVVNDLRGRIDAIIDGGASSVGVESTVIDMTGKHPVILRPGGISFNDIKELLPDVEIDKHILKSVEVTESPKCPGMKYKHYAPDAEVYVVEGEKERVSSKIKELLSKTQGRKAVISADIKEYEADLVLYAGKDNKEYANNLFDYLRECDKQKIETVFAAFCYDDGYGLAVKNRLYKSAANRVIKV